MTTRSHHHSPPSTSFEIDIDTDLDTDLDLDATTPVRSFDVRAAFDFDQTFANPDHPLITAERDICRERERTSSPPPPPVFAAPPPSYRPAPPPPYRRASSHSAHPESQGSLAPTAMELPHSYFASFPTPANGIKAPPLSIVSTSTMPRMEILVEPAPFQRGMSGAKIALMFGALAFAAALVAFTAAMSADSDVAARPVNESVHHAAIPQAETTSIPMAAEPARTVALSPETAQLFAPADPNTDWRARLQQGQAAKPR